MKCISDAWGLPISETHKTKKAIKYYTYDITRTPKRGAKNVVGKYVCHKHTLSLTPLASENKWENCAQTIF